MLQLLVALKWVCWCCERRGRTACLGMIVPQQELFSVCLKMETSGWKHELCDGLFSLTLDWPGLTASLFKFLYFNLFLSQRREGIKKEFWHCFIFCLWCAWTKWAVFSGWTPAVIMDKNLKQKDFYVLPQHIFLFLSLWWSVMLIFVLRSMGPAGKLYRSHSFAILKWHIWTRLI